MYVSIQKVDALRALYRGLDDDANSIFDSEDQIDYSENEGESECKESVPTGPQFFIHGKNKHQVSITFSPPVDWPISNIDKIGIMQRVVTRTKPDFPGTLLLPTGDAYYRHLAKHREGYLNLGWRMLIGSHRSVLEIGNKVNLQKFTRRCGITDKLPTLYTEKNVVFPCTVNKGDGEYGKKVFIVQTESELSEVVEREPKRWLIQELIPGKQEVSTTMVVVKGVIKFGMSIFYTYKDTAYVWPHTSEVRRERNCREISDSDKDSLAPFVINFTGVCNVNYKFDPMDASQSLKLIHALGQIFAT